MISNCNLSGEKGYNELAAEGLIMGGGGMRPVRFGVLRTSFGDASPNVLARSNFGSGEAGVSTEINGHP